MYNHNKAQQSKIKYHFENIVCNMTAILSSLNILDKLRSASH